MKGKKLTAVLLLSVMVVLSMLSVASATGDTAETGRMKHVKITADSVLSLLSGEKELDGIVVITLPKTEHGRLCIGKRGILRGEGVAVENLDTLYFAPAAGVDGEVLRSASFEFTPVYADGSAGNVITYSFADKIRANNTPMAENLTLATYADISVTGVCSGMDPDADPLTYTLVTTPKHGTVSFTGNGGTFVYTPTKTGTDSFTFTVTDDSGAVSDPAKVTVSVTNQKTDLVYADMNGRDSHYAALRLAESGIFTGKQIADCTYFEPDAVVTRGEFIAMAVAMAEPTLTVKTMAATSPVTFLDDMDTPVWCKPFAAAAVSAGFIQGSVEDNARLLRANDPITRAEAAVVLTNILSLDDAEVITFYADEADIPTWAKQAMTNVDAAGLMSSLIDGSMAPEASMTRGDVAKLLCRAMDRLEQEETESVFRWFW